MKLKGYSIVWFALVSILILSACSNQDHSQHQEQSNKEDHSQHQQQSSLEHSTHQNEQTNVETEWKTSIQQANQEGEIQLVIKDQSGKPIPDFQINHEKKLHLIVVSEDLGYFDHLHPEWKGNGKFMIKTKFPKGGKYRLYADFIPQGGNQVTAIHTLAVEGAQNKQPIQAEQQWLKTVDEKEISLKFTPEVKAGQKTKLTFTLKDAKTKQSITNLEQYLGAVGHVVIISQDTERYLHVHPVDEHATGPEARFETTFPNKGIYKIWGQFSHQGKVITVPFVVNVDL